MIHRAALALVMVLGGPIAAQDATGRWSIQIRGPVDIDRGDLRIDAAGGRLLLESDDSRWMVLESLVVSGGRVAFRTPGGREFRGVLVGDQGSGTVADPGGLAFSWRASRIQRGTERWPVRPRITVRQILVGTAAASSQYPGGWREAVPEPALLSGEHAALAAVVGMPPATLAGVADRADAVALGFDPDGRAVVGAVIQRIGESPAADAAFREIFRGSTGEWRLDLHDVAWQAAAGQVAPVTLERAALARLLSLLGMPVQGSGEAALRRTVWNYWQRAAADRAGLHRLSAASDREIARAATGLAALLSGYDFAEGWWVEAVGWLMTHRWIDTGAAWHSPVDLVAAFWERDDLPLPPLEVRRFGDVQAAPVIGVASLGDRLLRGANGVGDEYLERPGAFASALDGWRALEFVETTPLQLVFGGETITLVSPASVARSRLGGFLAAHDAIRIESGIMPLFAVGTVIHEWQHLLLEATRLTGPGAPGLRDEPWGLRLLEGDPWLAEGAAEWMTERLLLSAGPAVAALRMMEAEKRLAIGARVPDDPHVLGYLLVRVAAERLDDTNVMRRLLVASLHDPRAIAAVAGFAGSVTAPLSRPPTLLLIPEVSYTMDGGIADGAGRRLILPDSPSEP